ncbi:PilZ domain-containing protein [Methylomonas sp. SURF-2]|uniref:PilZ domain-containing protein n=1 Tax=Methylomonas subterranea TaxID=2952225 RepID=A0ABT1TG30_9GAMM|nr:PilZ domain-containing protein [Methylomonas sp. SURF-2]MCQ8104414.1 PilZ domain-containing protein [Methylomonas sp. SURF-2]
MTNTTQMEEHRAYRKNVSCQGLIYLGFEELPIKVINLSLSGFLAELSDKQPGHRVKDIFNSLQVSPRVDIYLPDMRIAGEAEVVRVETVDAGLLIGIEFRDLSYDIDSLLYNRRAYRKNLNTLGEIVIGAGEYVFTTQNVSVDGLMVRIARVLDIQTGSRVSFSFKDQQVEGEAEVIWVDFDEHTTLLGLKYVHLQRDQLPGVPRFVRDQVLSAR